MTMSHTEEKACHRWWARYNGSNRWTMKGRGANTIKQLTESSRCIASECMMWRWDRDDLTGNLEKWGYCGLAGKPE
jgi:hypothetical protein